MLFKRYGHPHAFERALSGTYSESNVETSRDRRCMGLTTSRIIFWPAKKRQSQQNKKKDAEESDEELILFFGDQTFQACTIMSRFMYDATIPQEVIYAIADGDI
jgi:hypothetical protein